MGKSKGYVLIKDLVIPAGTALHSGPSEVMMSANHECTIGFGKDHSASIYFDDDLIKENVEFFKELTDGPSY